MDTPPSTVGPGIGAFIAFFVLALCLWLLMRNMNGRMRRMAYREQQRVADLEAAAAISAPKAPKRRTKRGAQRDADGSVPADLGQADPDTPGPTGPAPTEAAQVERDEPTP